MLGKKYTGAKTRPQIKPDKNDIFFVKTRIQTDRIKTACTKLFSMLYKLNIIYTISQ